MTRTSFVTGIPYGQTEPARTPTLSQQARIRPVHVSPYAVMLDLDSKVDPVNIPPKTRQKLLRHLSDFIPDLDKIDGTIEETKPHNALIRRWRKFKFEMEVDVNGALTTVNSKETKKMNPSQTHGVPRPKKDDKQ